MMRWGAIGLVLMAAAGCDGGGSCVLGEARDCTCSDGSSGTQVCTSAGSYGACVCTLPDGGLLDGAVLDDGGRDGGDGADGGERDGGLADGGVVRDGSMPRDGGPDGSMPPDGGGGGRCDFNGFTSVFTAVNRFDGAEPYLIHEWTGVAEDMFLEIFWNAGATESMTSHTFTAINYDSCPTCLVIFAECNSTRTSCGAAYLAQEGTVTFSALSRGAVTGTLTDVRLIEVEIDRGTFRSTPVPGGRTWCISSLAFSGAAP